MPGRSLIELSSTLTSDAPTVGGRTGRPCSMPGMRTLWTYWSRAVTMSGRSTRGTGRPSTVHSRGCLRAAPASRGTWNMRPPISSAYVTRRDGSDVTVIAPSRAVSCSTGTPRRVEARPVNVWRAVAAASARPARLKFAGCDPAPDVVPWSGVMPVSHWISRTRLIGTLSSSATSCV